MDSMVTIVNDTVLYLKVAKRINLSHSHQSSAFLDATCPELLAWLPAINSVLSFNTHKRVLTTRKKTVTIYGDGC